MPSLEDFFQVPTNDSHISMNGIDNASDLKLPPIALSSDNNTSNPTLEDVMNQPTSFSNKLAPETFDWDKSSADRYVQSNQYMTKGFDPYLGSQTIDGKAYDSNELKYEAGQTWGDVAKNAIGGAFGLAKNTFVNGWEGWKDIGNALTTIGTDKSFMEALAGSPEELKKKNDKQMATFNKYAIFKGPDENSNFGVGNKEFLGDMVQQAGFGIGAGAQFLSEMLVTWGIGEGLGAVAKGAGWLAKGVEETDAIRNTITMNERGLQLVDKGEVVNAARKVTDPTTIKEFANNLWDYAKQAGNWAADQHDVIGGFRDVARAKDAGASTYQMLAMGTGGITRSLAAINSAATEARFEAANTYGQMYGDLINEWQSKNNGEMPSGDDLDRIKRTAYSAGVDNFGANTALLMLMNQLEWGNIMSKFGSSSRLVREAAEVGDKELFSVSGKLKRDIGEGVLKEGQEATQAYTRGKFGVLSAFSPIRKDFGLGTALWQVGKRVAIAKGEIEWMEGIQELLQNASDQTFRDYYTNLYHGGKDINGNNFVKDLTSADWASGLQSQANIQGWQTFLMGAATGLFLGPIQSTIMQGFRAGYGGLNAQYRQTRSDHNEMLEDNKNILNTFYNDPRKALNEHINGIKVQGQADKNMQEAILNQDQYSFQNAKDDAFAKAVSTAIKTGNYESFRDNIHEFGDKMNDEEFEQAFGLKATSENRTSAKQFSEHIVKDIEQYHDNWERLQDEYSHLVQPELYTHDKDAYNRERVAKKVLDDAIEVLATTSHHADNTIKRALKIRTDVASLPGIGISANRAFDNLGDVNRGTVELSRLNENLKNLEGLKSDPTVAKTIANTKEQIKHLTSWVDGFGKLQELNKSKQQDPILANKTLSVEKALAYKVQEQLKDAHLGYISAVNQENNVAAPILNRKQVNDLFVQLMDYNTLHRDSGQYLHALNAISDPQDFARFHMNMVKGAVTAITELKQEHEKEAEKRAAAENGTHEEYDTKQNAPIETSPDDIRTTGQGRLPLTNEIRNEIVRYYTETDDFAPGETEGTYIPTRKPLDTASKEWLSNNSDLRKSLDEEYNKTTTGKLNTQRVEELIDKSVTGQEEKDKELEEKEEQEKETTKDPVKLAAQEKAEKKKELQTAWGKELTALKEQYPILFDSPAENKDIREQKEVEINKKYQDLISTLNTPQNTIPESTVKMKILNSQVSIGAFRRKDSDGKFIDTQEEAERRLADKLTPLTKEEFQQGLTLTVKKNTILSQERKDIEGNDVVYSQPQRYSMELQHNGEPIGYLTNAGFYTFKIGNKELSTPDLSLDQFSKLMEIPANYTLQEAYNKFQQDYQLASTIQTTIEQKLASGQDTFSGAELQDILSVIPSISLDYVNNKDDRRAPLAKDLKTSLGATIDGQNKLVVVDNSRLKQSRNELAQEIQEEGLKESDYASMVLGESSDLNYLPGIPQIDNLGMYSAIVEITGVPKWIQLTPTLYNKEEMQSTLDRMKELTTKGIEMTDSDKKEVDNLTKGIFIALPTHEREDGVYKGENPDQKWNIRLSYNKNKNTFYLATDRKGATKLSLDYIMTTPEELATSIQRAVEKKFPGVRITEDNFRHQIPLATASTEEKRTAVMNMTASVYPNVARSISLRYGLPEEVESTTLSQESTPGISNSDIIANATPLEDITPKTKEQKQEEQLRAAEDADFEALKASRKAKKVIPADVKFDENTVENISKFKEWVSTNLPDFFSVDELSALESKMHENYTTVGQFVGYLDTLGKLKGSIQTSENAPAKYHEAFHGVFRLLLPQEKIDELLAIAAKQNRVTDKKLQELRDFARFSENLSKENLISLFHEEYLADEFDKWKMGKKKIASSPIRTFFQRVTDFIKNLFSSRSASSIRNLFQDIDAGKYKKASLQQNSFTDKIQEGISEPALKMIKIEDQDITTSDNRTLTVGKYLPQTTGDQLSSNIAALYHKMAQGKKEHNKSQLLNQILDIYKNTYDTSLPIYKSRARAITDIGQRADWMNKLIDLENVLNDKGSRQSLIEAVDLHLNIMGYRQELDDQENESLEEEVGSRNTDTAHKKTSPLSDYGSLSKFLREYIGSTTYQLDKDEFGNTSLSDGTPLYNTVSANKVYNGLLATVSNVPDESQLLEKLAEYTKHQGNPETTKFINRLFDEVGITDLNDLTPIRNEILLQQVLKGFNQYSTQYLFTSVNQNGKYQVSYANTRDAARVQFSTWRDQFASLRKIKTIAATKLQNSLSSADTKVSNAKLDELSTDISKKLQDETGIALHPMYIKYSIVASKRESSRTPEQAKFFNLYSSAEPIGARTLSANFINPLSKGTDLFARDSETDSTDENEKVVKGTPSNFLLRIAAQNALFDESINTISFTNASNETVYAHQLPNFDFVAVRELNSSEKREALSDNPEYNNFLLSDPKFNIQADRNNLSVLQIDGLRKVYETRNESSEDFINNGLEVNRQDGVTYGDYNKREFLATLLGFYDIRKQPDARVSDDKNEEKWYQVPVMTRTIEAKSSAHLIRMAVIDTVTRDKNGKVSLSGKALDRLYEFVQTEFDNIKRAKEEINSIENDPTYTGPVIEGYHTGAKRGLKFFNNKQSLGELATEIEADTDKPLDEKAIKAQLNNYWMGQSNKLVDMMAQEGLIAVNPKNKQITNKLAPDFLFKGYGDAEQNDGMNMRGSSNQTENFLHNISQILMNDYINTVAINQLILGNEAKSFKDPIDQVKRMAGANAQGPSMQVSFTSRELGIEHTLPNIHHVTFSDNEGKVLSSVSGETIQGDDGQMYGTAKGLRYALFGFGKLNQTQADILTRLENSDSVSEKEFFEQGGLKDKGPFNSLKLVYYDGATYLKCSMISLFREMTSYKGSNGKWQAQIGKEAAHELLDKMEDFEEKNGTVVFAHPASVSKAMKVNVASSISNITNNNFNQLQSRFMRQQLENPSNKLTLTDPSQAKQQIMSEQILSTPVLVQGKEITIGKVIENYQNDISQRVANNYNSAVNDIFNLGDKAESFKDSMINLANSVGGKDFDVKLGKFFDRVTENLRATGADQQTIGFFENDENGVPKYNPNFPSALDKFTSLYLNYFSRGVVAEKVPGQTLALVSGSHGLGNIIKVVKSLDEKTGQPKEWTVITRKEYLKSPKRYENAKTWSDSQERTFEGLKVGDVYVDSLRHNVPIFNTQGNKIGQYSEYVAPAHYKEEADGVPDALRDGFGVRIPADDKHSYISLRKIDTLPVQYGSVGIFPHELVEISGADFDIDKIYVGTNDTYVAQEGGSNQHPEYTRKAYGTATTDEDKFKEYVEWMSANDKRVQSAVKDIKGDLWQGFVLDALGGDEVLKVTALKQLGLPSSSQEYKEATKDGKELNNGVLNNNVLAQRIAMQTNNEVAKFSDSPISTKPLLDLTNDLIRTFEDIQNNEAVPENEKEGIKEILPILKEETSDVNSLIGKAVSNDNNQQGARNIGATANAIQAYSLNNQYKVEIGKGFAIHIDSETFNSFAHDREYNPETKQYDGTRIAANMSTLLNAMTDNAKERLAARLGLNINALGYVSNMIATGVPLKTAVLMMLQPGVRDYFAQVQKLSGSLKTEQEQNDNRKAILRNMLFTEEESGNFTTQDLIDNITDKKEGINQLVLKAIKSLDEQGETIANISKVQKLAQGLPTTWKDVDRMNRALSDIGIKLDGDKYIAVSDEEFKKLDISMDVRKVLLHDSKIIATNLKVLGQVQYLSKKVFLEKTNLFGRITDIVGANMKTLSNIEAPDFNKNLKQDVISFLSIKAYIQWLKDNGRAGIVQSLNNAMIYPSIKEQMPADYQDVNDIVNDLKSKLTGKNENYLLSKFLMLTNADENKEGINTAEANTWARLSDSQQDKLVSSFIALYTNSYSDKDGQIETHDQAVALFNYLLVKDGGQFKSGSFIRFMPNFVFEEIMGRTTEVNDLLSQDKWNEDKAQKLFGVPSAELINDFMQSYSTHIGNRYYIKKIKDLRNAAPSFEGDRSKFTDKENQQLTNHILSTPHTKPVDVNPSGEPIIYIDVHRGIRDTVIPSTEGQYVDRKYSGKKYSDFEKALLSKNKKYIQGTGLSLIREELKDKNGNSIIIKDKKGKEQAKTRDAIEFPYSIKVNNELYVLKSVGGKLENSPSSLIDKDQTISRDTSAQYVKADWTGAPSTFKASGVFGPLPVSKIQTKSRVRQVQNEEESENLQQTVSDEDTQRSIADRLAQEGIVVIAREGQGRVAIKDGKEYQLGSGKLTVSDIIAKTSQKQNVSSIDFKGELDNIYSNKSTEYKEAKSKEDFLTQARELYTTYQGKLTEEKILEKLKECL